MKLTKECPYCRNECKKSVNVWCDVCEGTREIPTEEACQLLDFLSKYFVPKNDFESIHFLEAIKRLEKIGK